MHFIASYSICQVKGKGEWNVRRILLFFGVLILLTGAFCACATTQNYWDVFRGAFAADVAGEWNGQSFGAVVEADPWEEGKARPLTITFYAPESLCGTVLSRDGEGAARLCVGDVCVDAPTGLLPLLDLFPTAGEISEAALTEEGDTLVRGTDFDLTLAPDGTPTAIRRGENSVTVLRFSRK